MWIVLLFNRVIIYQLVIYYHVDYEELNMRTCVSFTSLDVLFIFLIGKIYYRTPKKRVIS